MILPAKPSQYIFDKEALISKTYDGNTDADIAAENYYVNGIVGEDDVKLNNPSLGHYDDKHAGSNKNITVNGLAILGEDAGNYILSSTSVSRTIGKIVPKDVYVNAKDQTKVYGNNDPELTYSVKGLVGEEQLSGSLTRQSGKNVGNYEISIGSLNGGNDYTISEFNAASLEITAAELVIRAEDKKKQQGLANPEFTFSYKGLVAGDSPSALSALPVATSEAVTKSPIGYYDIQASGATSSTILSVTKKVY